METRNRSSYPDSPHPSHGHPSDWITKPYSIVFTAVVLFIIIFGIAIFLGWRQFETSRHNALMADRTTANLLADLIQEHNKANIGILQSYANRPLFIAAVKNKDVARVYRHLSDLKKNAEIDLPFVTDKRGIVWANFPVFPEAIGKNLSNRDWYKGVSSHWKPYISTVFKLIVGDKPLAVAVCVPIFDEKGRPIGVLASSQRLGFIDDAIERVPFSPYTTVNVIDRARHILYSNKFPYRENIADYRFFLILEAMLKAKKQQIETNDPQKDQEKRYLTVVPVGDIGWSVVIERSLRDIYRSEFRRFIEIGAVSFLLFLLIIFFLIYLRKVSLFRKTEELLQAETKLRLSEETLRSLSSRHEAILAAVPEIIMEVDNNKVYTWANSVGIKFFGEDVIGKETAFYFEGEQDTYDTVMPLFNGAEDIIYVESRQRRRDGEKRLLACWCRALKDENGNVKGVLSSAYDITDRKQAEAALRVSEERYRKAFMTSPDSIVITRLSDGMFVSINKGFTEISGYTEEEIVGKTSLEINIWKNPEDRRKIVEGLKAKGEVRNYEACFLTKDGEIYGLMSASIIELNGEPHIINITRDITERKQAEKAIMASEEKYRNLFDNAVEGVFQTTPEGWLISVNMAFSRMFGYESPEEAIKTVTDIGRQMYASPDERKRAVIILSETGYLKDFQCRMCRKDGSIFWASINARFTKSPDGIPFFEGFILDITDRRKAEEIINKLNAELEQRVIERTAQLEAVNRDLESFSYSVSHDLRAPLRSIDGFSQALLEEYQEKLDDTGKGYLERVHKATKKMGFLIDDLLKLSKVTRSELNRDSVDLSKMIRAIAEAQQKSNPGRAVDMTVQEEIIVQGDPYLMQIVLGNMMDNAWKFTGKEAHPQVEFGTTVRDGKTVCFIRDNGVGFDMAYAGKLFGAFQRLHTKEEFAGTGIGLATVKRIINRHGGHVWAEGEVGKGATFYFTLPSQAISS